MQKYWPLLVFLVIAFSAAAFGAAFPPGEWYAALSKPSWTPPNWLFGPVWSALYAMIGFSGWRLWNGRSSGTTPALAAWGVQLVLNALWSWIFFGLERPGLAFIEIAVLWLAILATMALAWRHDRLAAGLLGPYLAWVSFASALTYAIWQLNPGH